MNRLLFYTTIFVFVFSGGNTYAQLLAGSAKSGSNSSLIFPGSTVGTNISENGEASFSYVTARPRPCQLPFFAGGWLSAKTQDGIGSIFKEGQASVSAKIRAIVGGTINLRSGYTTLECDDFNSRTKNFDNNNAKLVNDINAGIENEIKKKIKNSERRDEIIGMIKDLMQSGPLNTFSQKIDLLAKDEKNKFDETEKSALIEISLLVNVLLENNSNTDNNTDDVQKRFGELRRLPLSELKLFVFFNQTAAEYYTYDSLNPATPAKSLTRQYFASPEIGLGLNYQYGTRFYLGITYGWKRGNTIDLMTKHDLVLTTTVSTATQKVVEEKKRTAYQGNYAEFKTSFLYVDALFFLSRSEANKANVLFNPYLRYDISSEKDKYPEITTLGANLLYRSKTKFQLGLYIEGFDLANNLAPFVATANNKIADLLPIYNRVSFGIITQFEIVSLFK